jgi:hypothetical protein
MKKIANVVMMVVIMTALLVGTESNAYVYRVCRNGSGYSSTGYGTHFGQPRPFNSDEPNHMIASTSDEWEQYNVWCRSYEVSPEKQAKYYRYKYRQGQLQPTFLHGGALEVGPTSGQITGSDGQGWGPRQ